MLERWRYAAALAVTVGIALPALAAAAAVSEPTSPLQRQAADPAYRPAALTGPIRRLHKAIDVQVARIRAEQRRAGQQPYGSLPGGVSQATLDAIGQCESGGDPAAVSADGSYRGKYQFDYGTWASVGGHGDPAAAPEAEQNYRAALLLDQSGSSPWPNCA